MDMCTLPCLKWITSEDPLCSSVLCGAWMVKGLVCAWLSPFAIHLNYHSTVNRLYPNTKKKKNREERTDLQCELLNFSPCFLLLLWSLRDWCSPGLPASWHPCTPVSSYSESHDNLCYIYVCIYSLHSELLGCGNRSCYIWLVPSTISYTLGYSENVESNVRKLNSTIRNVGQHYAFSA